MLVFLFPNVVLFGVVDCFCPLKRLFPKFRYLIALMMLAASLWSIIDPGICNQYDWMHIMKVHSVTNILSYVLPIIYGFTKIQRVLFWFLLIQGINLSSLAIIYLTPWL